MYLNISIFMAELDAEASGKLAEVSSNRKKKQRNKKREKKQPQTKQHTELSFLPSHLNKHNSKLLETSQIITHVIPMHKIRQIPQRKKKPQTQKVEKGILVCISQDLDSCNNKNSHMLAEQKESWRSFP